MHVRYFSRSCSHQEFKASVWNGDNFPPYKWNLNVYLKCQIRIEKPSGDRRRLLPICGRTTFRVKTTASNYTSANFYPEDDCCQKRSGSRCDAFMTVRSSRGKNDFSICGESVSRQTADEAQTFFHKEFTDGTEEDRGHASGSPEDSVKV